MRRRTICIVILVALASPGAASTREPADSSNGLPWNPSSGLLPREALWNAVRSGSATLEEVLRLQREQLHAPADRGGSGLIGLPLSLGSSAATTSTRPWSIAYTVATRDLDGDGLDEVLTFDGEIPTNADLTSFILLNPLPGRLTVRRGIDGAPLWSVETNTTFSLLIEDVTGDRVLDVVVVDATGLIAVPTAILATADVWDRVIAFRAFEGKTSRLLWSVEQRQRFVMGIATGFVAATFVAAAIDTLDTFMLTTDIDGDGVRDLFVGSADALYDATLAVLVVGVGALGRYAGTVYSGRDGGRITRLEEVGAYAAVGAVIIGSVEVDDIPQVRPAGDVNGDALGDFLIVAGTLPRTIRAVDAAGETQYWAASFGGRFNGLTTTQLNGTGPEDVLLDNGKVLAFDGSNGAPLWTLEQRLYDLGMFQDIDSDSASDLFLWRSILGTDSDAGLQWWTISLQPLSGPTGLPLRAPSERTISASWPNGSLHYELPCHCFDHSDLDGDGLTEPLFAWYVTEGIDEHAVTTGGAFAWSARDGSAILDIAIPKEEPAPLPLHGDFNDNGSQDLAAISWTDPGPMTVTAREATTYRSLWSIRPPLPARPYFTGAVAGNLVGDLRTEMILNVAVQWTDAAGEMAEAIQTFALTPAGLLWLA